MINISSELGRWPKDYSAQTDFINQLKTLLSRVNTTVVAGTSSVITLTQTVEPTQDQWELAWVSQTGFALPISENAALYWWDSSSDSLGGIYGTLLDSDVVQRRESTRPPLGRVLDEVTWETDYVTTSDAIGFNNLPYPSITFTSVQRLRLEMTYEKWAELLSGSGAFGADFLLDGVKVGTEYYSLPVNMGMSSMGGSGSIFARAVVPSVEPGEHTIQVIFGYNGVNASPPTVAFGGVDPASAHFGVRQLSVVGYTV